MKLAACASRARTTGLAPRWRLGVAFALVAWWDVPRHPWALPALWWLTALGIALAVIDLDVYRLPRPMVLLGYPVGAALLALAERAGGRLELSARAGGGLCAELHLPRAG